MGSEGVHYARLSSKGSLLYTPKLGNAMTLLVITLPSLVLATEKLLSPEDS